jgi:hypothetical protein
MFDLPEVQIVRAWVATAIARIRSEKGERGEIAQTVIIVAILAAAAIAIATVIAPKLKDKADTIPTQ